MSETVDFLSICAAGMVLRTRDRSLARITRVAAEEGLIHGEVTMFGPCCWRRDGVYRESPCGAAGPLDLMLPDISSTPPERRNRKASLKDALAAENRFFCCD
jgi:hypothetical protein